MPNAVHHGEEKWPYNVWMTMVGVAVVVEKEDER